MLDREQIIDDLLDQAINLDDEAREKFFAASAAADTSLLDDGVLKEMREMLDAHDRAIADGFLATPYADSSTALPEVGGYEILRLVGEGGMGEVYLARDKELDNEVAIKFVRNLGSKDSIRRFHTERRILAQLKHQNIAKIFKGGATSNGTPYLVMEWIDGEQILSFANAKQLNIRARLELFQKVCAAVDYAHQHLIVHRDIKPANILVTPEGEPKLLDFGIAKLLDPLQSLDEADQTATALRAMTPEYASPEQFRGEPITTATDVYSLGIVLYELLTGCRPYRLKGRRQDEIAKAICEEEPPKPSVAKSLPPLPLGAGEVRVLQGVSANPSSPALLPKGEGSDPPANAGGSDKSLRGDLDNIVLKALRKEPERRYASVGQFSADIRRYLDDQPVSARKNTFRYRASKFVQRNKIGVAAAAIILLTLCGGIAATSWQAHVAQVERARAEKRFNQVRKLANSFMFEFHDSIKDVPGTLKARQLVVRNALKYLDSLAQEAGNDLSLTSELAIAYDKVGSITFDVQQATESHRKAMHLNEALVKADPKNAAYRRQLAESYDRMGDAMKIAGHSSESIAYSRKALVLVQSLASEQPADPKRQQALSESYNSLGAALSEAGDFDGALENDLRAIEIEQRLAASDVANKDARIGLANCYAQAANDFGKYGDYANGLEYARKSMDITRAMLETEPSSASYRRDMWAAYVRIGRLLAESGDARNALGNYDQGVAYLEQLSAADPEDVGHRRWLAVTYLRMGDALSDLNRPAPALDRYRKALSISESLFASDPSRIETRKDLAEINASIGRLLTKTQQAREGLKFIERAMTLSEESLREGPQNSDTKRTLAGVYESMGNAYETLGAERSSKRDKNSHSLRAARDWYQRSLDKLEELRIQTTLSRKDEGEIEQLKREIAKCDKTLAGT